jgi:hypothetical protein
MSGDGMLRLRCRLYTPDKRIAPDYLNAPSGLPRATISWQ